MKKMEEFPFYFIVRTFPICFDNVNDFVKIPACSVHCETIRHSAYIPKTCNFGSNTIFVATFIYYSFHIFFIFNVAYLENLNIWPIVCGHFCSDCSRYQNS